MKYSTDCFAIRLISGGWGGDNKFIEIKTNGLTAKQSVGDIIL